MPADSLPRSDSNGGQKNVNSGDNVLSSSPGPSSVRVRTDSESSDKLARFILPSMDGSPPKVLTLGEVANVVKNIQNMELAHEIALNPEFKLEPYEPPIDSLEGRVKEIVHRAFWDTLQDQLNQSPPNYDNAIQLLSDIKECFPQILSQNNSRVLNHINEVLDATLIRQQAERGVLDFNSYAKFIINIMAKSCAPARDEAVAKLSECTNVIDTFRGILETMTLMKLDMANFLLDFSRNDIMANSVEYEKEKFKEYLEYYKFGFPITESWLKRNSVTDPSNGALIKDQTISNAYVELADWNDANEFPEVLSLDKERTLKLGQRANRLCVCACLMSICSGVPIVSQRPDNKNSLAKQIHIILQGTSNEKEIMEAINNEWEQIRTSINGFLREENQHPMDESNENRLKVQIMQIGKKDGPVRALMWKRLVAYFRLVLRAPHGLPQPPSGYMVYREELESWCIAFRRVIAYNNSVFGDYFRQILTQRSSSSTSQLEGSLSTSITVGSDEPMPDVSLKY